MMSPILSKEGSKFPLRIMGISPGFKAGGIAVVRLEEDGKRSIEVARDVSTEHILSVLWKYDVDVVAIEYNTTNENKFAGACRRRMVRPKDYKGDYDQFVEKVRQAGDHIFKKPETYAVSPATRMAYEAAQHVGYRDTRCQLLPLSKRLFFVPPNWEQTTKKLKTLEQIRELMVRFYGNEAAHKNALYYMNNGSSDALAMATYVAVIHFLGTKGDRDKINIFHQECTEEAREQVNHYLWHPRILPRI